MRLDEAHLLEKYRPKLRPIEGVEFPPNSPQRGACGFHGLRAGIIIRVYLCWNFGWLVPGTVKSHRPSKAIKRPLKAIKMPLKAIKRQLKGH